MAIADVQVGNKSASAPVDGGEGSPAGFVTCTREYTREEASRTLAPAARFSGRPGYLWLLRRLRDA